MSKESLASLFGCLSRGVYVVGVADGERRNAFTAASVGQVSYQPLLLSLSINPHNASYELLRAGRVFSVNILKRGQVDLARQFGTRSGRDEDKLIGVGWRAGYTGAPILEAALGYVECSVAAVHEAGDHMLVLGRALAGGVQDPDAMPLLYSETGNMDGAVSLYPARFSIGDDPV